MSERVVCPACGVLNEDAETIVEGLHRDLNGKRLKIARLEGNRADSLRNHPRYAEAIEVLDHWRAVCMPKAYELESPRRLAPVIERLEGGHTVEGLMRCADGYAKRPYVVNAKRVSSGPLDARYVEVDLIYKDDKHVKAGLAYAKLSVTPAMPKLDRVDWRQVKRANHRLILETLEDTYGAAYYDPIAQAHYTTCPKCESSLTVFDDNSDSLLWCKCGIDERAFFAALVDA